MAKYTLSNDGKYRTTIKVSASLRCTEEELKQYNEMAQSLGYRNFREYTKYKRLSYIIMLLDDYYQNKGLNHEQK